MRLRASHRRTPRAATLPALLFAAVLGAPDGAAGQDDLERVEALAADGRTDEARVLLMEWWGEDREAASREDVQRGIWLRGRLTVDPGQAALEYWRLVVEYPGGPYTTGALERIGRGAAATGDTTGAVRAWETLVREHRGTPAAERARGLLDALRAGRLDGVGAWYASEADERAEGGDRDPAATGDTAVIGDAPVTVDTGAAGDAAARGDSAVAGGAVGTGDSTVAGDSARAGDPVEVDRARTEPQPAGAPEGGDPPTPAELGDHTVQLGAFRSLGRARELMELVRRTGLEPRLARVPGSDLLRVRVGRLETEAEADTLRRRVVGLGFEALLADDARQETPVGGGG